MGRPTVTTTTANLALPKPEITDRVADGWDAIADLADALDTYLAARASRRWLKAGDTARAAGVAYSADPHLAAMSPPVVAGAASEWEFRSYTSWAAASNALDVRQYWTLSGAGVVGGDRWCDGPSTAITDESAANVMVTSVRTISDPVGYGIGAATYNTGIRETWRLYVPAGITAVVNLFWAPIAGSGGNVTARSGSFVVCHRIA